MDATAPAAPDPLIALSAPATELEVRALTKALGAALDDAGIEEDLRGSITLAVSEALNNVTEHAYAGRRAGQVHMMSDLSTDRVLVTLTDSGRAMPGNGLPAGHLPDSSGTRDDLPEGGFGWHLIHTLCLDVTYTRQAGTNTLCMVFPRHAAARKS